jgi:hypothetical protein
MVRVFRLECLPEDAIGPMRARLKPLHACDQWHSSRVSTAFYCYHCKFRPNAEGAVLSVYK